MSEAHDTAQRAALALVLTAVARAVRPKADLTVSDWADRNRILSTLGSAEPGPWKTSRTPFLREIMDQLSERSTARKVVFMKSSQVGGTEAGSNWLGYIMDHAKGPVAVVMPTEKALTDWMSQKFEPLTETPAVREVLAGRTSGDYNAQRKGFVGGILYAKTAKSTADLKSTSLRYALADEVDEYDWSTDQGDPLGLLEVRLTTFHDRKIFVVSSPTLAEASRIEEEFEAGDQRRYHVPCPHCGGLQFLKWGNVQYRRAPGMRHGIVEAWYACEHCGAEITENDKPAMLARGRWIPANPGAPYPSYHISALYSPLGLGLTWAELAHEWVTAQDDRAKLMRFINTRLGETFRDASAEIRSNALHARAEPYDLRTIPPGCLVVTTGVDVQKDRLEVQVLGHGRGDRTWTLDYHVLQGSPSDDSTWNLLTDYVNAIAFENRRGKTLRSEACAIDTGGHHTHEVYTYVRAGRVRRPMAIKGATTPGRPILGKPSWQDVNTRGKTIKKGVALYQVGTDTAKHLLYKRLETDGDKPPEERLVRFSQGLDEAYFDQLVAEVFNPRKNRWELKKGKRNEALDTWVYALAASHHPEIYLHKWRKADWDRREAMLEPQESEDRPEGRKPAVPVPQRIRRPAVGGDADGGFGSSDWNL